MADRETVEGYLYAWRANRFDLTTMRLISPLRKDTQWITPVMKASCNLAQMMGLAPVGYFGICDVPDHEESVPIWDCHCGFYCYDTLESYMADMDYVDGDHDVLVLVLAKIWGKVIQHECGYRTQYISVDTLFLPEKHMWVGNYVQQDFEVVVEPLENATQYDKLLPRPSRESESDGSDR